MGCCNWAMKAIGDLADLDAHSGSEARGPSLHGSDFDGTIKQIEANLHAGIASMPNVRQDATAIFAAAAMVQAAVMRMNLQESLRYDEVKDAVDRVLDEIRQAHQVVTARQIPWPACVAGCMASKDQRPSFVALLSNSAEGKMGQLGNCKTVIKVIRRCWYLRDSRRGEFWDCSSTMQEMGMSVLLI
ncbi:fungal-specific transcription factor domain-containing protein [Plectosphaerella plurivora]|uniref:Fungal-specific transcription factor domain-containing protein n=1 Tax=Plectosphaerella plurivora TaxID=936078 RepID=A0A9P9A9M0_9PEZI|nr:fungal-specific transcription factor domain-containing protein [Plectosphaerella plurivora]